MDNYSRGKGIMTLKTNKIVNKKQKKEKKRKDKEDEDL